MNPGHLPPDLADTLARVTRSGLDPDAPELLAAIRDPRRVAAARAAEARPGSRDDDGQLVVDPRTANVRIVCACDYGGGSCGSYLGGVWRTPHGVVLIYSVVRPDARAFIQAYKGRRRGTAPPRPGDRYPDRLLTIEVPVLLEDAGGVLVSCPRCNQSWPLNLVAVRRSLEAERLTRKHQKLGSRAPE